LLGDAAMREQREIVLFDIAGTSVQVAAEQAGDHDRDHTQNGIETQVVSLIVSATRRTSARRARS
jgi:hypothetical protein